MFSLSRSLNYLKILLLLRGKIFFGSQLAIFIISFLGIYIIYRITVATNLIPKDNFIVPFIFVINLAWIFNLAVQSSKSFKNIHDANKMMAEFIIPISHFERFEVTKIFYGGGTLLFMLIANLLLSVVVSWVFDWTFTFYFKKIPTWAYLDGVYYFVLIFCFFFAGSIYLKSAFLKVAILILILIIAISSISDTPTYTNIEKTLNTWFDNISEITENSTSLNNAKDSNSSRSDSSSINSEEFNPLIDISGDGTNDESSEDTISLKKILLILMGFLFYIASYFKLKKIQLK